MLALKCWNYTFEYRIKIQQKIPSEIRLVFLNKTGRHVLFKEPYIQTQLVHIKSCSLKGHMEKEMVRKE